MYYVCRFDGGAKSNVSKQETVCQDRGVPASNGMSPGMGLGEMTRLALGENTNAVGINSTGISGADYDMTRSNTGENLKIRSKTKDTG